MRIMSLVLAITVVGCGGSTLDLEDIGQLAGSCPIANPSCNNSDEVAHYGILDLNLNGKENLQGIKIYAKNDRAQIFDVNGTAFDLYVEQGYLIGRDQTGGVLAGGALQDATIALVDKDGPVFDVHVKTVRTIPYPVGDPDLLEVYTLTWNYPGQTAPVEKNMCNYPLFFNGNKDREWHELQGMDSEESLVFEGDRINGVSKTMSLDADFDPVWFNIGCAGHTLAKLRQLRHTTESQSKPDWAGRQAAFKMLVADYCGTGRAFTVAGTPLRWMGGDVVFASPPQVLEARWTETGATCVNVPRLEANPSLLYPDIWSAIHEECTPPPCANPDVDDFDGAKRVSGNP